tara:strand:+ start:43 stop:1272 length:1230 start_codon:yes stop_codon:yes gene_type:complete
MNKNNKILIVSHQFTPHVSPRTTRWKLIVEELISLGHQVTVITGTKQDQEDKDVNIIYVGNKNTSNIVKNFREKSNNLTDSNLFKRILYNSLKKIYRFTVKTFAWPDYSMFWLISIYRNRKKLKLDYDLLITVSLPFSSHIAGYLINKKNNKKWVMDIGDPFTLKKDAPENNYLLYGALNKYFENKLYSLADKIMFTHNDAMHTHKEYFKLPNGKVVVANPISKFDKEIYQKSLNYNYNSLPIKFGYFGIFTKGVRSPINFLETLRKKKNIEFHWYVNNDSQSEIIINNQESESIVHSIVPRNKALNIMAESMHCLLSIGNLNPTQLPSKVIEYISTGKPVVHFAEIENDPVIKIANDFDNLFIITSKTNLDQFFIELTDYFKSVSTFNKNLFNEQYTSTSIIKLLNLS